MSEVRTIKRYSNRKLYDLQNSRYVTLQEIAELLQQGIEVQIIDNKTKEDITPLTLTQILYEQEKNQAGNLPIQTLKGIIRSSGELFQKRLATPVLALRDEAEKTVLTLKGEAERKVSSIREEAERRMGALKVAQSEKRGEMKAAVNDLAATVQSSLDEFSRSMDERVKQLMRFTRQTHEAGNASLDLLAHIEHLTARLEALEQRLAELEKKLSK